MLDAALSQTAWDALVVGAGPAGSLAARQLSQMGKRVLLVDKATFPRQKVCGGCLNSAALQTLRRAGLGHQLATIAPQPIHSLRLVSGRSQTTLTLHDNVAVGRDRLDAMLAEAAAQAGATLLTGVAARPVANDTDPAFRTVQLTQGNQSRTVAAKIIVVAAGLQGWHNRDDIDLRRHCTADSRVGIGTMLTTAVNWLPPGVVQMVVGRGGYVGMVRLGDDCTDVAAAVDRRLLAMSDSPAQAVAMIFRQAGIECGAELHATQWHGTPPLTHRLTHVAGWRLLMVGDAAGYVEPFTGEGMAWAMQTALAAVPFAARACDGDHVAALADWELAYRGLLANRHWVCSAVARVLRYPGLTSAITSLLGFAPWLAAPILRGVNRPQWA